ncbi:hypothetical protein EYF80_051334 [Liparis tanakae]|uniref:Uncharacterized protein n=1 Tax=Liparis tanakae TaxID=230148 RepID=A0A4Z2FC94_9TELE|nr:hypothetical protein EYF80_051334 [Liparis tanakae]
MFTRHDIVLNPFTSGVKSSSVTSNFVTLSGLPLCWAERVSLRANTFPHTEISLQTPGAGSDTNSPAGCITSTPLVDHRCGFREQRARDEEPQRAHMESSQMSQSSRVGSVTVMLVSFSEQNKLW